LALPPRLIALTDHGATSLAWRYLCHSLMLGLAMLNERRAAPSLPDTILSVTPYIDWIDRHNYHLWLLCYVPIALTLYRRDRGAFLHFMYVGGVLSLLRGVCICMTGLGPVRMSDVNAGLSFGEAVGAWWALVNPLSALGSDVAHVYLTKDLYFSGHTATTFMLWLYCRPYGRLGTAALVAHGVVVASVFLSHLHYTIDVIGAWTLTWALFTAAGGRWRAQHAPRWPTARGVASSVLASPSA
jgi:hypothetical protein